MPADGRDRGRRRLHGVARGADLRPERQRNLPSWDHDNQGWDSEPVSRRCARTRFSSPILHQLRPRRRRDHSEHQPAGWKEQRQLLRSFYQWGVFTLHTRAPTMHAKLVAKLEFALHPSKVMLYQCANEWSKVRRRSLNSEKKKALFKKKAFEKCL